VLARVDAVSLLVDGVVVVDVEVLVDGRFDDEGERCGFLAVVQWDGLEERRNRSDEVVDGRAVGCGRVRVEESLFLGQGVLVVEQEIDDDGRIGYLGLTLPAKIRERRDQRKDLRNAPIRAMKHQAGPAMPGPGKDVTRNEEDYHLQEAVCEASR